ncbi:MAG TPA: thiopeptide-type bacteriocin biosynthesis protein [Bryobacteraceae bacterium]|nr:thiopeptide-type bacteriocin biosynthesis protein [Bryobacteraceae bacterium]
MATAKHELPVEALGGRAEAARFTVARVAGVSATVLERLTLKKTLTYLEVAQQAEAAMADLGPGIEDALYTLVPQLDHDKDLRRRVLALKRNIHNQRVAETTGDDVRRVAAQLTGEAERFRLEEWLRFAQEREENLENAKAAYSAEMAEASGHLAACLENPALEQGLAIASPDLLSDLYRVRQHEQDKTWSPASKLSRSCLSYLSRAAMKTSPLSTFTQVALASIGAGQASTSATNGAASRKFYLLKLVPHSWLSILARHPEFAPAFQFECGAGISPKPGGKTVRVLATRPKRSGSFVWRREETQEQELDANGETFLQPGRRFTYKELIRLLNRSNSLEAHVAVVNLLNRHRIQPVAPYARHDFRPLRSLANALELLHTDAARTIAGLMLELQQEVDRGASADGAERLHLLSRAQQMVADIYRALDAPVPDWVHTGKLLFEDVAFNGPAIRLPEQVQADLKQAAEKYREGTIRTKLYDYLYLYFVRKFGPNGEAQDILGFLFDFLSRSDFEELLARAIAEDKLAVKEHGHARTRLPGGRSAIPPTLTIFFQLAAESDEALQRSEYELIVNQVNSGEGGLLGRFAPVLGVDGNVLRTGLHQWVQQLYEGHSSLELPVCADSHNLQGTHGICGRTLRWPGELPAAGDDRNSTLRLDELRLRARPDGTLEFAGKDGEPVGITYQGVVPPYLAPQALRLLMLIADPWIRDYSPFSEGMPGDEQNSTEGVQFSPRQQQGRVVFRRAQWRVPAACMITRTKGEGDFDFFARAQNWRKQHGLPEEVFVRTEGNRLSFRAKERKPAWIHFGSPHSLELLTQMADGETMLTFTEVAPARREHWTTATPTQGSTTELRASEFMGLVRWPMPQKPVPLNIHRSQAPASVDPSSPDDWLYFKIYPRQFHQLDRVIEQIVHPAICRASENSGLERWHFLRYADERGWHIRLRLRGAKQFHEEWSREIRELVDSALPQLGERQPAPRLISSTASFDTRPTEPGCESGTYEPEYEKYGGAIGVAIAEELFEASSDTAVKALLAIQNPTERFLLYLSLTRSLVQRFHRTPDEQRRFLEYYLWYWSGQDRPGASQARQKLREAARHRRTFVRHQLDGLAEHAHINSLVDQQEKDLAHTLNTLRAAEDEITETPARLSFDYLHMNNNRLGVLPSEEAYLAALLLASV